MAQSKSGLFLAFLRQILYIVITIAVVFVLFWLVAMPKIEERFAWEMQRTIHKHLPTAVDESVKTSVDNAMEQNVPDTVNKILADQLAKEVNLALTKVVPQAVRKSVEEQFGEIEESVRRKMDRELFESVLSDLEQKIPAVVAASITEHMMKLEELAEKVYTEAAAVREERQKIEEEIQKAAVKEVEKIEEQEFFVINVTGSANEVDIAEGGSDLVDAVGPMVTVSGKYGKTRVLVNPKRPIKMILTGKFNNIFVPKSVYKRLVVDDQAGANKIIVKSFWNLYGKSEDLNRLKEME